MLAGKRSEDFANLIKYFVTGVRVDPDRHPVAIANDLDSIAMPVTWA